MSAFTNCTVLARSALGFATEQEKHPTTPRSLQALFHRARIAEPGEVGICTPHLQVAKPAESEGQPQYRPSGGQTSKCAAHSSVAHKILRRKERCLDICGGAVEKTRPERASQRRVESHAALACDETNESPGSEDHNARRQSNRHIPHLRRRK